jgi:hypothetical protein
MSRGLWWRWWWIDDYNGRDDTDDDDDDLYYDNDNCDGNALNLKTRPVCCTRGVPKIMSFVHHLINIVCHFEPIE